MVYLYIHKNAKLSLRLSRLKLFDPFGDLASSLKSKWGVAVKGTRLMAILNK